MTQINVDCSRYLPRSVETMRRDEARQFLPAARRAE